MKFSYEDLISGDSIFVNGIGHFRSPQLKELKPTQGIGTWKYNLYIGLMAWDRSEVVKFMKITTGRNLRKLEQNNDLSLFDVMTLIDEPRMLLHNAMAFFVVEDLIWDKVTRSFLLVDSEGNKVGAITRENFEDVRDMMLQMNYINIGESAKPVKHSSAQAQELWERAQQYLKEESTKAPPDKNMNLGNIISKLCAASTSYNLFNIYDLTVFQLYDQFFQYGYLRAMNLNEMAFSNHGGENFDMQGWLKPIIKI